MNNSSDDAGLSETFISLSSAQESVFFDQLVTPESPRYNLGFKLQLDGEFDVDIIRAAINLLLRKHASLRSRFVRSEKGVEQKVQEKFDVIVSYKNFLCLDDSESCAHDYLQSHFENAFDVFGARLCQAAVAKTSNTEVLLAFYFHHLLSDGISGAHLVRDFLLFYARLSRGYEVSIETDYSYQSFVREDALYRSSRRYIRDESFWMSQFETIPEPIFTYNGVFPEKSNHRVSTVTKQQLSRAIYTRVEKSLVSSSLSMTAFFIAIVSLYIAKIFSRREITIGVPLHNRLKAKYKTTVGMFSSIMPLTIDVDFDKSFVSLIQAVESRLKQAYKYQRFPLAEINRMCKLTSLGRSQLYDVSVSYEAFDVDVEFENGTYSASRMEENFQQLPLGVAILDYHKEDNVEIRTNCNRSFLDESSIKLMGGRFISMIEALADNLELRNENVPIMGYLEHRRLIGEFNSSNFDYPLNKCIHGVFEDQVKKTPDLIALSFDNCSLTFTQLNEKANKIAFHLISLGVTPSFLVGICLERGLEMVACLLGVLKAGGAYLPLDPSYPADRLSYILEDSGCELVLSETDLMDFVVSLTNSKVRCFDSKFFNRKYAEGTIDDIYLKNITCQDLAYVIYTSGSTGKPKGVMVEHRNVLNLFRGLDESIGVNGKGNWLAVTSISFDISVLELFWTLCRGNRVVIQPSQAAPESLKGDVDFSLFYFAGENSIDKGSKYHLLLEGAKYADKNGFSAVWVPERHFATFGDQFPNPSVAAAAVAAITTDVKIRAGSIVLPLHDPLRAAEEWSMVDNLSGGRVELSIAPGWHPNDFVLAPDCFENRHQVMRDRIGTLKSLWRGESCIRKNGAGKQVEIEIHPKPVQSELKIWITSAGNEKTFEYAGSIGASVLTHLLGQSKEELRKNIETYRTSLKKHGFDQNLGRVALMLHTFVGEDLREVERIVEQPFKNYLKQSIGLIKPVADEAGLDVNQDVDEVIDMAYQKYFTESGLFGTVDGCLGKVQELQSVGVDEFSCLIDFGVEHEIVLDSLSLLKELKNKAKANAKRNKFLANRYWTFSNAKDLLISNSISHLQCTPSYAKSLLDHVDEGTLNKYLKTICIGGELLPSSLAVDLLRLEDVDVYNMYGPTETTVWSSISKVIDDRAYLSGPIYNTQFYVLSPENYLLPEGVTGELHIGGAGVTRGYYNKPGLTSEKFIPNPFGDDPSDRLYKTGDLVRWLVNGSLEYVGRIDYQVKIRGFRIELGEIESNLCDHPSISEALVIAIEGASECKQLVAYLIPDFEIRYDTTLDLNSVKSFIKLRLPNYMHPNTYVVLDTFPLTPNGKVDRLALALLDAEHVTRESYVAPQGQYEITLASIWQELLGIEQVSRYDNFFDLGGHSLLAVQLRTVIEQQMSRRITLKNVFDVPLLHDLALLLQNASLHTHVSIVRADRKEIIPLSWSQQRLWFIAEMDSVASRAYHMSARYRLVGELNIEALEAAFVALIDRHEVLRTNLILSQSGQPVQVINQYSSFRLKHIDLSSLSQPEQEASLLTEQSDEDATVFDMRSDSLIRGRLANLGADVENRQSYILLITLHHVVTDGWSKGVLVDEISSLYNAFNDNQVSTLPSLDIQYADFACWQRSFLVEKTFAKQIDYWKVQLASAPTVLDLPLDSMRPPRQNYSGESIELFMDTELTARLHQLARSQDLTLHMLLLGVWGLLLSRLSGQREVVVGIPVANRAQAELKGLIGFFVNTLAIRIDIDDKSTLSQFFNCVKEQAIGAYSNQDVPFEKVVEVIQPIRSLSHSPVFQAIFDFENTPAGKGLHFSNISISDEYRREEVQRAHAKFDLSLSLREQVTSDGAMVIGDLTFASSLFELATIKRWIDHFKVLLSNILDASDHFSVRQLSSIDILTEDEFFQLTNEFNNLEEPINSGQFIHELFEFRAGQSPNAPAVISDGHIMTYDALNKKANQVANYLLSEGVKPDALIGISVDRRFEMIVGVLGILKAGAAYVPLDHNLPCERITYMLNDSEISMILTVRSFIGRSAFSKKRIICIDETASFEQKALGNLDSKRLGLTLSNLAYVIYTSGTTGEPKGVAIEHRGLSNLIQVLDDRLGATSESRVLQFASFGFDACVWECFIALCSGSSLYMSSQENFLPGRPLVDYINRHHITHALLPPSVLRALSVGVELKTLHTLIAGGEECPESLAREWSKGRRFINAYGPSEATVCSSICSYKADAPLSIGKPIPNTQFYILDERSKPVPIGVRGEIYIGGEGIARGYIRRPELTLEKFVSNPFVVKSSEERLYKSGDLGYWNSDGTITYVGRNDDQVKVRGFRVELSEVEVYLRNHSLIEDAAVIVDKDSSGQKQLVGYIVPTVPITGDTEVDLDVVRASLKSQLPSYMIPSVLLVLERFPRLTNGKLDRKGLLKSKGLSSVNVGYQAPSGEIEEVLAMAWRDLLNVERVSRNDNFFHLGGHSLLVVQLVEYLRQFGWTLPIAAVFSSPSFSDLAETVVVIGAKSTGCRVPDNLLGEGTEKIEPNMLTLFDLVESDRRLELYELSHIISQIPGGDNNIQDIYPLTPLQKGFLFHHRMEKDDLYIVPTLLNIENETTLNAFLDALQKVIDRHDILRTAFFWEGLSQEVQVVYRKAKLSVKFFDLDSKGCSRAQMEVRMRASAMNIDLKSAPLITADVAKGNKESDGWFLLIQQHHLITDHLSNEIIIDEIHSIMSGNFDSLETPIPYRNLVAHAIMQSSNPESETYFRSRLGHINEPTMPFSLLDVHGGGLSILEAKMKLNLSQSRKIRAVASQYKVSAATIFHMAWGLVVSECSYREEIVFGTVMSGRLQGIVGSDRILGLCLNILPLNLSVYGSTTICDFLYETNKRLGELLPFEQIPLVDAVKFSGLPAGKPLFSATLNYRNSRRRSEIVDMYLHDDYSVGDWGIKVLGGEERSNYPFSLVVDDFGEYFGLTAKVDKAVSVNRVLGYVDHVLSGIIDSLIQAPQTLIQSIPILPENERHQLVNNFNEMSVIRNKPSCFHEMFESQVRINPELMALVYEDQTYNYGELNERANRLAHYLISQGVKPDTLVAIYLQRSFNMVVGLLGILKAGGAYLPIDPNYPEDRISYMLTDSSAPFILTQQCLSIDLLLGDQQIISLDSEDLFREQPSINPDPYTLGLKPSHLAYVIYTSGSTGAPKGVLVTHENLANYFAHAIEHFYCDGLDGSLFSGSVSFDGVLPNLYLPLLVGKKVIIVDELNAHDTLMRYLRDEKSVYLKVTPSQMKMILADCKQPILGGHTLFLGGEKFTSQLYESVKFAFPNASIFNHYGPTETTIGCCAHFVTEDSNQIGDVLPVGTPINNAQIYVLNENMSPVPVGALGQIYIGGLGVARGYLNQPDLTKAHFVADPFTQVFGARIYKTGDLGRWNEDGTVTCIGRNDSQVKYNGYRIELGEIEVELRRHPLVIDALVTIYEDGGDADSTQLVAYLIPVVSTLESDNVDLSSIRQSLVKTIPEHMVPTALVIVKSFPTTANGKLDLKKLPRPQGGGLLRNTYFPPVGRTETILSCIWQEILNVDDIGRYDSFFDLGGHSLSAARVVSRIELELKHTLSIKSIFDSPKLFDMANLIKTLPNNLYPRIESVNRESSIPLSTSQERLWFIAELDVKASRAYHVPVCLHLTGDLNLGHLERALSTLMERHEILRTTFSQSADGKLYQVVSEAEAFCLERVDLSSLEPVAKQRALEIQKLEEFSSLFNMRLGPLIRGRLIDLGTDTKRTVNNVLLITMHHIVSDAWSKGVLVSELSTLYDAYSQGKANPLSPLVIQYADYAMWQRNTLEHGAAEDDLKYWESQLSDVPKILDLPTDRSRPAKQCYSGGNIRLQLRPELCASLKMLSSSLGLTIHMLLLGAWGLLLSRLSNQAEVTIGVPVANRPRADLEDLMGFFVNTLPIRVCTDFTSIEGFLEHVRTQTLDAYAHGSVPLDRIVDTLQPIRDLSYGPLFQTIFAFENTPERVLGLSGVEINYGDAITEEFHEQAQFDLSLSLSESLLNNEFILDGYLTYCDALFDRSTVERWSRHFEVLLEELVSSSAATENKLLSSISMITKDEQDQLRAGFCDAACSYETEFCVHELFEAQVEKTPFAIAVVFEDQALNYHDLNEKANQLAHLIISQGVVPDSIVGLYLECNLHTIVGMLGILKAGGAYLPIDPTYPSERISYIFADSGVSLIVTQRTLLNGLPTTSQKLICIDEPRAYEDVPKSNINASAINLTPSSLAYVMYTSGTTGLPKGVMVEHNNVVRLFKACDVEFEFDSKDVWTFFHSYAFDFSVWEIWGALSTGARLIVVPRSEVLSFEEFYKLVANEGVTVLSQTPSSFEQFSKMDEIHGLGLSLRYVVFGGEALASFRLKPWVGRHGFDSPELINMYGITETTVHSTFHRIGASDLERDSASLTIGRPLRDIGIRILTPEGGLAPIGVQGEIYVCGGGLSRGYLNRPDLTSQRFILDQSSENISEVFYKTGDLGRWNPDGTIKYLGRNDRQVKLRGFRIELGEIESRLRSLEMVEDALVIVIDNSTDTYSECLVGYIVISKGNFPLGASGLDEVRLSLKSHLPDFMVPSALIMVDQFTLTANGKIDVGILPKPDASSFLRREYEPPVGAVEEALAKIWSELLGVKNVGRNDNFFDLGGHSILVVQLISQINKVFEVQLPMSEVFDDSTLLGVTRKILYSQLDGLKDDSLINELDALEGLTYEELEEISRGIDIE